MEKYVYLFLLLVTQPSDSFARRQQQQNIQLTHPHSNTSDTSFYPGSVPQASPVGSVDSNINPRTPLSNNPLTPQSMQPLTPQSNLALATSSALSSTATPLPQIQQQHANIIQESEYLPGNTLHSSPVLDDQSHLQYLNTPLTSITQSNTQFSGSKSASGFQQIAYIQGNKLDRLKTII